MVAETQREKRAMQRPPGEEEGHSEPKAASLRDTERGKRLTPTASFPLIACPVTGRLRQVSLPGQSRVKQGEGKIWRAKGR